MKKNINLQIANPAGNITAFVLDPIKPEDYLGVANAIMALPERGIEQVGYIKPVSESETPRMEMMGGEFCGNATRSFGYLISMENQEPPKTVRVSVSGTEGFLEVEIDHERGSCKTAMPCPLEIKKIEIPEAGCFDLVIFEGIAHLIVPGKKWEDALVNKAFTTMKAAFSWDALGIMFLESDQMTPVVWVRETDSTIWESSCGSGSLACGVFSCVGEADGLYIKSFKQPGGTIETLINIEKGWVTCCQMGGPVTLEPPEQVKIDF